MPGLHHLKFKSRQRISKPHLHLRSQKSTKRSNLVKKSNKREERNHLLLSYCTETQPMKLNELLPERKHYTVSKFDPGSTSSNDYFCIHFTGEVRMFTFLMLKEAPAGVMGYSTRRAIAKIVCYQQLAKLRDGIELVAPNFPALYRICYVEDVIPDLDAKQTENQAKPSEPPAECRAFVAIERQFCGTSLTHKKFANWWQAVSLVSQVFSAVAIAEVSHKLEIGKFRPQGIHVLETETPMLKYTMKDDLHFSIDTLRVRAFIWDLPEFRIAVGEDLYCSDPNKISQIDDCCNSEKSKTQTAHGKAVMVSSSFRDPKMFYPRVNILWMKQLIEAVSHTVDESHSRPERILPAEMLEGQESACKLLERWYNPLRLLLLF